MIVLSPEISEFWKESTATESFGTLRNPASSEILGRRLTDLIGSFTKNPDTLRTKFSRLWLKKGGRYTVLYLLKLGSLSNDDSDGNENGEKATGLKQHIYQTITLHVHITLFCSLRIQPSLLAPSSSTGNPGSQFVSRTGFVTWVNIANMGRSLGLGICQKVEIKIDEIYHVASCCCPQYAPEVSRKIASASSLLCYVGKMKRTIFLETSCAY